MKEGKERKEYLTKTKSISIIKGNQQNKTRRSTARFRRSKVPNNSGLIISGACYPGQRHPSDLAAKFP